MSGSFSEVVELACEKAGIDNLDTECIPKLVSDNEGHKVDLLPLASLKVTFDGSLLAGNREKFLLH